MIKDLNFRGLVRRAIAADATTPNPGSETIIWSTTENKPLYWDGSAWKLWQEGTGGGSTPNMNDVFGCDWFIPQPIAALAWNTTADTFDFTHASVNPAHALYPFTDVEEGQTLLLLSDNADEGVYTLGSVSNLAAVPLTRHASWPATRNLVRGTIFLCARGTRSQSSYNVTISTENVSTADSRLEVQNYEAPLLGLDNSLVVFSSLDTGATLPSGLVLGRYYVLANVWPVPLDDAKRKISLFDPVDDQFVVLTSTGVNGSGGFICSMTVRPRIAVVNFLTNVVFTQIKNGETAPQFGKVLYDVTFPGAESGLADSGYTEGGPALAKGAVAGPEGLALGFRAKAGSGIALGQLSECSSGAAFGDSAVAMSNGIAIGAYSYAVGGIALNGDKVFNPAEFSWFIGGNYSHGLSEHRLSFSGNHSTTDWEQVDSAKLFKTKTSLTYRGLVTYHATDGGGGECYAMWEVEFTYYSGTSVGTQSVVVSKKRLVYEIGQATPTADFEFRPTTSGAYCGLELWATSNFESGWSASLSGVKLDNNYADGLALGGESSVPEYSPFNSINCFPWSF